MRPGIEARVYRSYITIGAYRACMFVFNTFQDLHNMYWPEDVVKSCKKTGGEGGSVNCIHKWVCCFEPLSEIIDISYLVLFCDMNALAISLALRGGVAFAQLTCCYCSQLLLLIIVGILLQYSLQCNSAALATAWLRKWSWMVQRSC